MASPRFKKVFAVRFLSYLAVLVALCSIIFEFGPVLATELSYRRDQLFGIQHSLTDTLGNISSSQGSGAEVVRPSGTPTSGFANLVGLGGSSITPVATDYGIVIEKINANSKVVGQVDPNNEAEYTNALAKGVAEAKGSTEPGQPGNLYIYSHSTDAPWNVVRYNAVFYLLRELDKGDKVVIFYKGRRFDYIVYDKKVVAPTDVQYLNVRYDQPVLTLQTCDPPGTLLNRLLVFAKLQGF